jgi:hypothetical protein
MNSRSISLILVAINLGLVVTLGYLVYAINSSPGLGSAPLRTKVVTNTITQIAVRKINSTNNLLAALANRPLSWRALESTNYVTYIENLRSFGCPEETIRDIIITDVAKGFARRRSELRTSLQPYHFWQTADPLTGTPTSPELQRQLRALDKEQRQLLRDLLGIDARAEMARYFNEDDNSEQVDAFLTPEKRAEIQRVSDKYDDLEQEIYWRSRGLILGEDQEELKRIQRERRAELATVLSAEEMENYDLRHSETSNNMRAQLAGFQPTEDEFRKIFRLQRSFEDNFDQAFDNRDEAGQAVKAKAHQEAQDALNEEVKKTLGPERFAEYQRVQDTDYRALLQLAERYSLNPDAVTRVFTMKQAAESFRAQVSAMPNLTDEQRARAVEALARETERSVAGTLGDEVFKTYQRTGGQWLANLPVVDENLIPEPPPSETGTKIPYDINLLPPDLRNFLLNPRIVPPPNLPNKQ